MFSTSLALLAQAFQGRDRGVALGLFGAVTGIAVAIGPVLGGAITTGLSWRWIFFVNLPIGIVALAISLLRIDESRNPDAKRPDWAGFVTFSAGLAALVYGLIESQTSAGARPTVVGSLAASAVLLAGSSSLERLQAEPMLDLGAAAGAHLRRRARGWLGDLGRPLLDVHVPDRLHAEQPRPLGGRDRRPLPAADGGDLRHRRHRRAGSPRASPGGC